MTSSRYGLPRPALTAGLVLFLLTLTAGCGVANDVIGGNGGGVFGNQGERVRVTIDELGRDYIVGDRYRYVFTQDTSFGRYSRPSDLSIGDRVIIEFDDERGRDRRVVRIERDEDRY